jgi:hypothetical protein
MKLGLLILSIFCVAGAAITPDVPCPKPHIRESLLWFGLAAMFGRNALRSSANASPKADPGTPEVKKETH